MVYRRKSRKPAKRVYRRRKYVKRYNRKMMLGNPRQKVFYYKRLVHLTDLTADADSADTFQNFTFYLSDLSTRTDFTNLYDFYQIAAVKVMIRPVFTGVTATTPVTGTISGAYNSWASVRIFSCIDYNNNPTITDLDTIRAYANCKTTNYIHGHTRYFRPAILSPETIELYKNGWLRSSEPSTVYGTLCIGVSTAKIDPTLTASGAILGEVEAVYYLKFKSPQ